MKVGDVVRLRPTSPLHDLLEPCARDRGRVAYTYQDDDDDGLRISVAFEGPEAGHTSPLSADEFVLDDGGPGEPS